MKRAMDRENLHTILTQMKHKEDSKLQKNIQIRDLQNELKQVRKAEAGYLLNDRQKQLEDLDAKRKEIEEERQKISLDLNKLNNDQLFDPNMIQHKTQQKVNNSEYLNDAKNPRNKKLQMIKEAAENDARFKQKQEILYQNKDRLNKGLRIEDMVKRGSSNPPAKSSLLNVGNDILNSSAADTYGNEQIQMTENRISKLMKDRASTIRQLQQNNDFDEIDKLKVEIDNGYHSDGNVYRKGILNYAHNIRTEREMNPKEKAERLANIRRGLDPTNKSMDSNRVNYQAAKPIMDKRLMQLNQIIKDQKEKEIRDERLRAHEISHRQMPSFEQNHNLALNNIRKSDRTDFRKPLIDHYSKNSSRMSDRINRSLNEKGRENRSLDPKNFLPDIGLFKQNNQRATDLEVEERAIMNMYAQDFDDLKILNMLSQNDELYQHKLQQYKETSNSRLQAEKALQKQRLELLKLHYSRENYEEDRKLELEKWMEEQQKQVVSKKIRERLNGPKTPEYREPTPMQIIKAERKIRKDPDYDPSDGFAFNMDYISNIPRGIAQQAKIAYAIFNKGEMMIGNKQMGPVFTNVDPNTVMNLKAQFTKKAVIKEMEPDMDSNLIIEVQIPEKDDPYSYQALGWTLLNLFEFGSDRLNTGAFKLPLYQIPTNPNLSVNDILTTLVPIDSYL